TVFYGSVDLAAPRYHSSWMFVSEADFASANLKGRYLPASRNAVLIGATTRTTSYTAINGRIVDTPVDDAAVDGGVARGSRGRTNQDSVARSRQVAAFEVGTREVRLAHEHPAGMIARRGQIDAAIEHGVVAPHDFRRHGRPTDVAAAVAPLHPCRAPLVARHPHPAILDGIDPATVVIRSPTPRLVR